MSEGASLRIVRRFAASPAEVWDACIRAGAEWLFFEIRHVPTSSGGASKQEAVVPKANFSTHKTKHAPGVVAGSLLTFIPVCGDFINAELLGSDRQRMLGNIFEKNFLKESLRPEMSAMSFVLMLLILAGVLLYAKVLGTDELG